MTPLYDAGAVATPHAGPSAGQPLHAWILGHFPDRAYPLTLVRDPDALLVDEAILVALAARGFRVIDEADPIALRAQVEAARPGSLPRPLVIRTTGPLNALPYDLWYEGHRIELGLHAYFPRLDYPTVRLIGPLARTRLSHAPALAQPLGPASSAQFVLRHAYRADLDLLRNPAAFLVWLAEFHANQEPMPAGLASHLAAQLVLEPAYAAWDLVGLLADRAALQAFVSREWTAYLQQKPLAGMGESGPSYGLDFARDPALQDAIARLVRTGALAPVEVDDHIRVADWARPAVTVTGNVGAAQQIADLTEQIDAALRVGLTDAPWAAWRAVAQDWAALQTLAAGQDTRFHAETAERVPRLAHAIDTEFHAWLPHHYRSLASLALPEPHHVFHVPGFLAYDWRRRPAERVALLVLDGMALRDWLLIAPTWRLRHPEWHMQERQVLAQVPSITSISRQALISGLRPAQFTDSLTTNRLEPKQWSAFWSRQDLAIPESGCSWVRLGVQEDDVGFGSRERAVCLIENGIDDIVHGTTLGAAGVQMALQLWLNTASAALEQTISLLLRQRFRVYVASDHGHVEATGVGSLAEGISAETRAKRVRIYRKRTLAERAQASIYDMDLWCDDGILPDDVFALLPRGRSAFAPKGDLLVTHGGTTLDELVVPFITIEGPA